MRRLIIGMTGSTGAIFGVRMLEALKPIDIESHLIISKWAQRTLEHETPYTVEQVRGLANVVHSPGDMGASISSGSFKTDGMVVIPCSVRTLGCIASGYGEHLVHRAADVVLKERRRLVLVVRETPLSEVHLENMLKLARMGVSIVPPVPAFYNHPQTIDDIVHHIVARGLAHFGLSVGNIDGVVGRLKAKGAQFTREPTTVRPGVRVAFLRGPEGVSIELLDRNV